MVAIQVPQYEPDWYESEDESELSPIDPGRPRTQRRRRLPDRATRIRRRRLAAIVVVLGIGLLGWAFVRMAVPTLFGTATTGIDPEPTPITDDVYVVQPGDTLWSIADRVAPDEDPREVVAELREINGGATVQVGDRLHLDLS